MTIVDLVREALVGKTVRIGGRKRATGKVESVTWAYDGDDEFLALDVEGPKKKTLTLGMTEEFEILEVSSETVEG